MARWARRPTTAQALAQNPITVKSSWINPVELWFGLLTDRLLRRGVHRSTSALEAAILEYIAVTNEQPRPFRWINRR